MIRKIFISILIILVGITFVFSGVTKYLSLDLYEISLVKQNIASWSNTRFITRLIISFEIALGLLLITHYRIKFILKSTIILLCLFSILLGAQILFGVELENCFCFGEAFQITNTESILKNGILILMSFIALKFNSLFSINIWKKEFVIMGLFALSTLTICILYPPINIYEEFNVESFKTGDKFPNSNSVPDEAYEGNVILAFLSPKCSHCTLAAKKLAVIENRNSKYTIIPVFGFGIKDIPKFIEDTKIKSKWSMIDRKDFLLFTKGVFPQIYILEDGNIKEVLNKRKFIEKNLD